MPEDTLDSVLDSVLASLARSLNRYRPQPGCAWDRAPAGGNRPGDDFNRRGQWADILTPHGWALVRQSEGVEYWVRPGKTGRGVWSATVGHCKGPDGQELLHVFTSSAPPFEPEKTYSKFAAHTLLNHCGDYRAAAAQLAQGGYGERREAPAGPPVVPPANGQPPTVPARPKKPERVYEPYQPFPVEALPEPVRSFATRGAAALNCDPSYLALPALAVVAGVIGNTRAIRLRGGSFPWHELPILWTMIVGDSGTLKTPAWKYTLGHVFRIQEGLFDNLDVAKEQAKEDYRAQCREYARLKQLYRDKEGPDPGLRPKEPEEDPKAERIVCSDTTVEKLAEMLTDNPRGLLVARDELAGWLASFNQYKARGGADLQNWLEMHSGGTVIVDRKTGTRPSLFVPHASVSLTGGIQTGTFARSLTPEFMECGLLARIQLAMPPRRRKQWSEEEVEDRIERDYREVINRLRALESATVAGKAVPRLLHFSAEARRAWCRFYNDFAVVQEQAEGDLAAAYSKLEGCTARLALLHHVVTFAHMETNDNEPIGVESLQAAITLCHWFAAEARRVYATLGETADEAKCRRLVDFITQQGGEISVRRLRRCRTATYPTPELAELALEVLVGSKLGEWVDIPPGELGGPATKIFKLFPTAKTAKTARTPPQGGEDGGDD